MKKLILAFFCAIILTSCGVGTYSITSGKSDAAEISFTSDCRQPITVRIDNAEYHIETVKAKAYKPGRNIKRTVLNTIKITPGKHEVKVMISGNEVYSESVYVSASEHRIVEL